MPDFYNREQLLSLKLLWMKSRISHLQDKIENLPPYLLSIRCHMQKLDEMVESIGLEMGEVYQELEFLKRQL